MILHGNNLIVQADGTAIALSKSCIVDVKSEKHEVAVHAAGDWKAYIPGRKSWSVQTTHLVTAVRDMLLRVGETYTLTLRVDDADTISGTAICTAAKITATRGNLIQGSFTFEGGGALS